LSWEVFDYEQCLSKPSRFGISQNSQVEDLDGKSKKKTGEYFLSSSSQILSHTTSLTLVKSNPIYECFLETSALDPKIQRWISWMPQGVDEIPKY